MIDLSRPKGAIFSEDRRYRYLLWRTWGSRRPLLKISANTDKKEKDEEVPGVTTKCPHCGSVKLVQLATDGPDAVLCEACGKVVEYFVARDVEVQHEYVAVPQS